MRKPNHPVFHVMRKEFIEVKRSVLLRILLGAPIMMSLVFGFVVTTDIRNVPIIICDEDNSSLSRQIPTLFDTGESFTVKEVMHDASKLEEKLLYNKIKMVVRIPHGFSTDVKKNRESSIQLLIDGSDSNATMTSLTRALSILREWSGTIYGKGQAKLRFLAGQLPSMKVEERIWYNPELRSSVVILPGLIGVIISMITIIVTAVSIVREKENGNIEQLNVTPVKPWQVLLGKILPYVGIAFIDIITLTLVCTLVFRITMEGSFLLLLSFSILMILANLGIGILISTISRTQQQAMLASIIFILPTMLLSGLIFAIRNMPEVLQTITYLIPMRYFLVIVRGIFLKGSGFMELWPQALALLIFSAVLFLLAIRTFHKKTV